MYSHSHSQGTPLRNNTDYNADLWHVNRKLLLNIVCEYHDKVNCQTRARNSRKEFPLWERCEGRFPNRHSQRNDFYHVLLFALTRCSFPPNRKTELPSYAGYEVCGFECLNVEKKASFVNIFEISFPFSIEFVIMQTIVRYCPLHLTEQIHSQCSPSLALPDPKYPSTYVCVSRVQHYLEFWVLSGVLSSTNFSN